MTRRRRKLTDALTSARGRTRRRAQRRLGRPVEEPGRTQRVYTAPRRFRKAWREHNKAKKEAL